MPRGDSKYRNPRTGGAVSDMSTRLGAWLRTFLSGAPVPARTRERLDRLRLFSVATRQYLRRRAWRYFRRLGLSNPERYVPAVVAGARSLHGRRRRERARADRQLGVDPRPVPSQPSPGWRPAGWTPAAGRASVSSCLRRFMNGYGKDLRGRSSTCSLVPVAVPCGNGPF